MDHFLDVTKMVFFYARNVIRVTLRVTFRVTKLDAEKRNVGDSVTFRVTYLTLLQAYKWGKRVRYNGKTALFLVFKGRNSRKKTVFEGQNSQESAYL